MKISVKKLDKEAMLPKYNHKTDAAMDLYSISETTIKPMEKALIKTGIAMAIPEGHVGLIWDRSGMAAKFAMHTMAGVIDSGYRGELVIVIINLGKENFVVEKHMKVAQIIIQPCVNASVDEVVEFDDISTVDRGSKGFGSSGYK